MHVDVTRMEKHKSYHPFSNQHYFIKVPQEGQYGLEIFAREKWEERMVHCCKYLINCDV